MNIKRHQIHNYQQLTSKKQANKQSKQPEKEQNHRYRGNLEGHQLGGEKGTMEEKVQGIRSIMCRYKIDRGILRIA